MTYTNALPARRCGPQHTGRLSPIEAARRVCIPGSRYPDVDWDRLTYMVQQSKDRLFVCYNPVQSGELRKMSRGIKGITQSEVEWRREHAPFAEEIDLRRP